MGTRTWSIRGCSGLWARVLSTVQVPVPVPVPVPVLDPGQCMDIPYTTPFLLPVSRFRVGQPPAACWDIWLSSDIRGTRALPLTMGSSRAIHRGVWRFLWPAKRGSRKPVRLVPCTMVPHLGGRDQAVLPFL